MQSAVQNGIENMSGTNVTGNGHPEDGYRFRARTAEELQATQHLVPTTKIEDLPPDDDATHMKIAQDIDARRGSPPPKAPKGWIL